MSPPQSGTRRDRLEDNHDSSLLRTDRKLVTVKLTRYTIKHLNFNFRFRYYSEIEAFRLHGFTDHRPALSKKCSIPIARQAETIPETNDSHFDLLPEEIIVKILEFLPIKQVFRVCRVSHRLRRVCQESSLLLDLDLRDFWPTLRPEHLDSLVGLCPRGIR